MQSLIHDVRSGAMSYRKDSNDKTRSKTGTLETLVLVGATAVGTIGAILLDSAFNLFS